MHPVTEVLLAAAAIAVIGLGIVYVNKNVTCWHVPYVTSGCTAK